jgi:hypothetical protein
LKLIKVDFRKKFAIDNWAICADNIDRLNEWEQEFINDIGKKLVDKVDLTQKQFNKLKETADKFK